MNAKKILALLLALMMLVCVFAGCGQKEEQKPDDEPKEEGKTENTEPEKGDDGKLVLNNTFYPVYAESSEYDAMKEKIKAWFTAGVESGTLFSVVCGEEGIDAISARFEKDIKNGTDASGNETVTAVYTDAVTGLEFTLSATLWKDFPAVDYVVKAKNVSDANTALVHDFFAVDSSMELSSGSFTLHTTNGGNFGTVDDYSPVTKTLEQNLSVYSNKYGRSTNCGWPYFNIEAKDCGAIVAVGWSGQWEAQFAKKQNDLVIKAKQQQLSSVLLPGEEIRTPSIVIEYYDGDVEYGQNIWRKMIVEHYSPENDKEDRFVSPICINTWGGSTAAKIAKTAQKYKEFGVKIDALWLDAGWYGDYPNLGDDKHTAEGGEGGSWSTELGWWTVNKKLFPTGTLLDTANVIHESGFKFLVWWMIEDACLEYKSKLTFGRDNYYSFEPKNDGSTRIVLRLDDDAVCDMVIDYFRDKLTNEGIDWIRVDNYLAQLSTWEDNDQRVTKKMGIDRYGMTENKYITNFYRIWDTLYSEFPDFMLDNCASGGNRLDIEMLRRGVALWRIDTVSGDLECQQAQTQWMSPWIPFMGTGVTNPTSYTYQYRSKYSSSCSVRSNDLNDKDMENLKAIVDEWTALRPYWYGSYYDIITPVYDRNSWQSYELFREDMQEGMIVIIRRQESAIDQLKIKFKGLLADQSYTVHDIDAADNSADFTKTGDELMNKGVNIGLSQGTIKTYVIKIATDAE